MLNLSTRVKKITANGQNYKNFKELFGGYECKEKTDDDLDSILLEEVVVKDLYNKYNKSLLNKMIWVLLKNGNMLNSTGAKLALRTKLKLTHLNQKNQKIVNKIVN